MNMPKYTPNVFTFLVFLFLTFAISIAVDAQFTVYHDSLNSTDGFTGDLSLFSANATGAFLTANAVTQDPVVHKFIPHFFLDKPLNETILSLLGGSNVWVNYTIRSFNNATGGSSERRAGIVGNTIGGSVLTDFRDQSASDEEIRATCGLPPLAVNILAMTDWDDRLFYRVSTLMNYTRLASNYTIFARDFVNDPKNNNTRLQGCVDVYSSNRTGELVNISLQINNGNANIPAIVMSNLTIQADTDADYFRTYTLNPLIQRNFIVHGLNVTINFSSPILVNATFIRNNVVTTLCTDCQDAETVVRFNQGENNITFNYNFSRGSQFEPFSKIEDYTFINYFTITPKNNQYFSVEEFLVNFTTDRVVNASITIRDNTTTLCTNCISNAVNLSLSNPGSQPFFLNFTNGTTNVIENATFFTETIIGNCTFIPIVAQTLNFTFKDENSEAILESLAPEVQVISWKNSEIRNATFSQTYANIETFDLCTLPEVSQNANYVVQYDRASFSTRRFNVQRSILDDTVQNVDLFLLSSADGTAIVFTIVDGRQQPLQGFLLEAHRSRIDNTFDLVETGISDLKGEVQFNLDQTREYKFVVKRLDNTILQTVAKFRPIDTTYTIEVDLDPSIVLKTLLDTSLVFTNLTFNNATSLVIANWSAASDLITQACLQIDNRTTLNHFSTLNVNCTSGDSGEITFNVTGLGNVTLLASLFVTSQRDNNNYTLKTLTVNLITEGFLRWGVMGLFVAIFVMFTVIGAMALNSPFLTVLSVMFGLFLLYFTGMTALSWSITIGLMSVGGLILYFIRKG